MNYWLEFDFTKTFFSQFDDLLIKVPRINLYLQKEENSPYSNFESEIKDCYLTVWWHWNENNIYVTYWMKSKNSVDNYWLFDSNASYENIICYSLYNCFYLQYSSFCEKCYFWFDLKSCKNCFWCVWLRNKEYFLFNKKYTKEEYFEKIKSYDFSNFANIKKIKREFEKIYFDTPHLNLNIWNSENCLWNDIFNSKNCINSFSLEEAENCNYSLIVWIAKDCMDCSSTWIIEKSYECSSWWMHAYANLFTQFSYDCTNVIYCDNCHYSSNLFWCVWLKNKNYCILNKQYTKEEYENLVPKIIEAMKKTWEWWEFFPSKISPFWYNETSAIDYYSLSKKEALNKWFNWLEYEPPFPKVKKIIPASKLPNYVKDIPDDILNWAIECEITKKPFRIIKQELDFYRKHNLPIPRRHPDQRHLDRMALINNNKLYSAICDKCWVKIKTIYTPKGKEIIYCEECYNNEVY